MKIQRRNINNSIEKRILTGLIVSDAFCKEMCSIIDLNYFLVDYVKITVKWVLVYYFEYRVAPGKHIQNLFDTNKDYLSEAEGELILGFLANLSKEYEESEQFNISYLIDQTVVYFRMRGLSIISENIKKLLASDKLDLAEEQIQKYKQVAKETTTWTNPLGDLEYMERTFEDRSEPLFSLPGDFTKLNRGFHRDWLVGFLGPMKRGKSWWLLEMATQAALHKLNTVFVSLEMSDKAVAMRFYKRLVALNEKNTNVLLPCFDCLKNQDGTCEKVERMGIRKLMGSDGYLPQYKENKEHIICDYCRVHGVAGFVPSVWYTKEERKRLSPVTLTRQLLALQRMRLDSYLRIKTYPAHSANLSDLCRGIASLEYTEDFIPDVIVIDYADILAPEAKSIDRRSQIDETWKMLKNMAATKHCLVVTASQSTRDSIKKKSVSQIDTAEDIRKLAHVDLMLSLNQTKEEKRQHVMRIGIIAEREDEYNEDDQVMVLQQLSLGQVCLDSYFIIGYR